MTQGFGPLARAGQLCGVGYIEHEKIVAARSGTVAAVSIRREFEVIGSARQLGQTEAITIEGDDLVEAICRPRDADLRRNDAVPEGQSVCGTVQVDFLERRSDCPVATSMSL